MTRAPTITQQTGWVRHHPQAICQDFDIRIRVHEYDFDLEDLGFQAYAKARGVLYLAGENLRWQIAAEHRTTRKEFLQAERWEPLRWWVHYKTGARMRLQTDDELEASWQIIRAAKGALQDVWELYQSQHNQDTTWRAAA